MTAHRCHLLVLCLLLRWFCAAVIIPCNGLYQRQACDAYIVRRSFGGISVGYKQACWFCGSRYSAAGRSSTHNLIMKVLADGLFNFRLYSNSKLAPLSE
jgi:hypothetical protein